VRESREFASEIKFQVPGFAGEEILKWARTRLAPDPNATDHGQNNGTYQITSLYFDTEEFDVYHRNGSFARSKYRIRRYGPSQVVFLERKLKTRGLVSKRRAAVGVEELERLHESEPDAAWPGFWYHQRLLARQLRPVCQITYRRIALVAVTQYGPLRLTLDRCIQTVPLNLVGFNDLSPGVPLSDDQVIVEFKFRMDMPVLFKDLVQQFALQPSRISKYRMAVVALGLVQPDQPAEPQMEVQKSVCLSS
jgi:VTC domain-containing protein